MTVILVAACGAALVIQPVLSRPTTTLADGSKLTLVAVTAGTNHVAFFKPLHQIIRAIPFLPKRALSATEPFGWNSPYPCVVVWCSWQGLTPTSAPPALCFVNNGGVESQALESGGGLRSYKEMVTVEKVQGMFAVSKYVPPDKTFKLRLFQTNQNNQRVYAGEWKFKNTAYVSPVNTR